MSRQLEQLAVEPTVKSLPMTKMTEAETWRRRPGQQGMGHARV